MTARTARTARPPADLDARRRLLRALIALLVLAVVITGCSADSQGDMAADTTEAATDGARDPGGEVVGLTADGASMDESMDESMDDAAASAADADREVAMDAEQPAEESGQPSALAPPTTASTGERIIKEGTVTVTVSLGEYDAAFGQIVARAQALGGHVSGTSSSSDTVVDADGEEQILTSGQVTIRVPVRTFEDLLTSIGDAGEIVDRNVTSQDVTAEYVDLESRLRNLQAQQGFYLGLLDEATTVPDAIAIQQQLDGIQGQIEQITGRLNLLEDRSAFSTLTIRLREEGATPIEALAEPEVGPLTPYVDDAVDTFFMTVGALLVLSTFVLPLALAAGLVYAIWRAARRQRQRSGDADAPAGGPAAPSGPYPAGTTDQDGGGEARSDDDRQTVSG